MSNPLQAGVTGGLGAGKSLICEIFRSLGIPIYNADERARWLMENSSDLIKSIISEFGKNSYEDGKVNRDYLAQRVFNNKEELLKLNGLVHPAVRQDGLEWAQENKDRPYLIREAALMIESGSYKDLDKLIVVTAPVAIRKERVLKRDPFRTGVEIDRILQNQMPEDQKVELADFVINNSGTEMLIPQVLKIHKTLLSLI